MTNLDILEMLKANLEIATNVHDTYLGQLIEVGYKQITEEAPELQMAPVMQGIADGLSQHFGILLEDIQDVNLIVMYAAYLYRKRADEGAPQMPRMLRYALNNRLFSQKIREES